MKKRKKLEVSTFPFLAVLLCTMGSLILLLLVIDKKAKKAALEKAYEAAWNQSKSDSENKKEEEKNQWIKLKAKQHEELAIKESRLEKEIVNLKSDLARIEEKIAKTKPNNTISTTGKDILLNEKKIKVDSLSKNLEIEKSELRKIESEKTDLSQKIDTLELILKELRASLDKDKFAFSIVPYFGKNGLNRKPLYIECNETGIIFFPDKTVIPSDDESDNLKIELSARTSQLRDYLSQTLGPKNSTPYLMILVRPGGITNYWKLQSVIKPMDIDFGYELVEKAWTLNIPSENSAPSPSTLAKMQNNGSLPRPIPAPGNSKNGLTKGYEASKPYGNEGVNITPYQNENGKGSNANEKPKSISYGATATNIRPLTSLPGFPTNKNPRDLTPNETSTINTNGSTNSPTAKNQSESGMKNNMGTGDGVNNHFPTAGKSIQQSGNGSDNSSSNLNANLNQLNKGTNSNQGNANEYKSLSPKNPNLNSNLPNSENLSGNGNNTQAGNINNNQSTTNGSGYSESGSNSTLEKNGSAGALGSNGNYSVNTPPPFVEDNNSTGKQNGGMNDSKNEKTKSANSKNGSQGGNDSDTTKSSRKIENIIPGSGSKPQEMQSKNISITINNKNKEESKETPSQTQSRTTYNREDELNKNSEERDPTARIAAPLPELGPRKNQSPVPLRAARLFADRDWIIYVECKFDELLVHPNKLVIPTNLLASDEGVKRFITEIEKTIQRKQSTVRPGEPPYRPEVRFLVWPDGLRPYHLTYPALQAAGIKQKRQNLEAEDSIREIIQGR